MSYTKRIVCFANSRKLTGRCVAGKEWNGNGFGGWIRPVSARDRGELTSERWYERTWRDPRLLDVIEMALSAPRPSGCQTENHLVDRCFRWKYAGHLSTDALGPAVDHPAGPLWAIGDSTACGLNDRVSAALADQEQHSLVLTQPEEVSLRMGIEGLGRRRVRGRFSLAGFEYSLVVTDPTIEAQFRNSTEGATLEMKRPVLCISLSEKFAAQNACYKLIAAVIRV